MAEAGTGPAPARQRSVSLPIEVTALTAILALALAVLAGAGAALYQRSRTANYASVGTLLIDQPRIVANVPDAGELLKLQLLRQQYAGLIKTETIAGPVSRQVNLPLTEVENDLNALVPATTFTLSIVATSSSASNANQIAQDAVQQMVSYVSKSQARIGVPSTDRVVLTEVTTPGRGVKVSVPTTKVVLPGVIAFIVVGGGFLIIADLLRRRQ